MKVDGSFEITLFFNKDIRLVNNNENVQLGNYGSKPYNKDYRQEIQLWDLDKERPEWGNTIYKTTVGQRTHNYEYIMNTGVEGYHPKFWGERYEDVL